MKGNIQVKSQKKARQKRHQTALAPSGDGLKVVHLPVSVLIPYLDNPRDNDGAVGAVADSIRAFGFNNPILIRADNTIIAGHTRLKAAIKLGQKRVPCIRLKHLSDLQAKAYNIADNRTGEIAEWEIPKLGQILSDLKAEDALQGIGWDDRAINRIINEGLKPEAKEDDDDVPAVPKVAITQPGDIITLGKHRLMCGDATKQEDVEKLMDGAKADMVFTDPPYGLGSYAGRSGKFRAMEGDDSNAIRFYQSIPLDIPERYVWGNYCILMQLNERPRDIIIWRKNNFGMGKGYRGQYEMCFYYGAFAGSDSDIWDASFDINREHPTQKPVELGVRAITNSSQIGMNVLDLFFGSGSTLIGCEKTGRICYGMEIDPHYCDVTVQRWENYTGLKAIRPRRKEGMKCARA